MNAETPQPAVRLENVTRAFGATAAVRDMSLDIRRGEVVSLVGHSGCGKSTLLRIIAGVETIDGGRVFLDGREVDGGTFVEPEARGVGFVFQDYALFPHLTARDNILFGLRNLARGEASARAADVIERVGIGHLADRYPHTLSGGEQQRVALARALAPRPTIVLMDEPFSNLDQGLRERVRGETLALLKSLDTTVVLVTHDPEEALSSGDRVVLMRAGEIVQAGTPYDLHDRPTSAYAAEFFCTFNKIPGIHRGERIETPFGSFPASPGSRADAAVTLYIRPSAISVSPRIGDFSARIVERVFRGESERIRLSVEGLEQGLTAVTMERLPPDMQDVRISISTDKIIVF